MNRNFLLLLLLLINNQVFGQKKIKDFVEKNINTIKTIEPDSLDFSDLEIIGKAIGDSRIVMLGEQDHGDGPTFLAKTRLIKYLHEKKGFNVLAFESDFFALNKGLANGKATSTKFWTENIFNLWTKAKQCDNLFNHYLTASYLTNNPLIMTGFDSQLHGKYSEENLKQFVDNYLQKQELPFTKTESYLSKFLPFVDSTMISKNIKSHLEFTKQLELIINKIVVKDNSSLAFMVLKNLYAQSNAGVFFLKKRKGFLDIRDRQMAENLRWLVQKKHPNEKIIVWAHNLHILKNPEQIKALYSINKTMGDFFTDDKHLEDSTYILGFTSKQGTAGRLANIQRHFTVEKPNSNGFENWMPEQTNFAFIDFKKYNLENPNLNEYFEMKAKSHLSHAAIWTNVFDGIFYIRDMYPTTRIE